MLFRSIGSHKANIGHSLTAAGSAGLIKVLMALKHEVLPPTPHFRNPSPKLPYSGSPFRILTTAEPWDRRSPKTPRRAALSGFGFGGINAHALIEEWLPGTEAAPTTLDPERGADPEPVAIIGLGTHLGTLRGRAVQELLLRGKIADDHRLDTLRVSLDRFRIPPKELEELLPQQLLALIAAADAIDDAGWEDRQLPRLRTGVFFGITLDPNTTNFHVRWDVLNQAREWNRSLGLGLSGKEFSDWVASLRDASGPPLTANRTMGALGGLVASRIAREFRLGGPSFTVSSEETSGLRAIEIAVGMLRRRELDEAVVGAVDLTGDPRVVEAANRMGVVDPPCGDVATAFILKRLDDAERAGDRIYAVIRGTGATSIESGQGVEESGLKAIENSGIDRGDSLEFETFAAVVQSALSRTGMSPPSSKIASDRQLLGQFGAATGLLSLLEAVFRLHQQILSPIAGTTVGPRYWLHDRSEGPRRAHVHSSGIDGVRISVLLEEASEKASLHSDIERVDPLGSPDLALFAVEADDEAELIRLLQSLDRLAANHTDLPIDALARRWWISHPNHPTTRLGTAFVARSSNELRAQINRAIPQSRLAAEPLGRTGQVALVFPGIGNHFVGMGRGLSAHWPEIFRSLDRETLRLRSQLAPGASWDSDDSPAFSDQRAPILGQVVLGTVLSDLLRSFGVRPDAVIGYSLGESSAMFATRTWTERDEMHARLDASPLFRTELAGPCDAAHKAWGLKPGEAVDWTACLLSASPERVREALGKIPRAYLLIINAPNEVIVGGQRRASRSAWPDPRGSNRRPPRSGRTAGRLSPFTTTRPSARFPACRPTPRAASGSNASSPARSSAQRSTAVGAASPGWRSRTSCSPPARCATSATSGRSRRSV